jgi:septal ring factor EnvC (AmiA/AmiB activator)
MTNQTETPCPDPECRDDDHHLDLLNAEEVPLPGISVAEMTEALRRTVENLTQQIADAREERSRLNAQLAEDRAELTRRAEERRLELNKTITEATEQLTTASRLLKASNPRKRAKKAP